MLTNPNLLKHARYGGTYDVIHHPVSRLSPKEKSFFIIAPLCLSVHYSTNYCFTSLPHRREVKELSNNIFSGPKDGLGHESSLFLCRTHLFSGFRGDWTEGSLAY